MFQLDRRGLVLDFAQTQKIEVNGR